VFRAATEGSAKILNFDRIGRLEPGYRADIVFLDIGHINYVPLRNPLQQMVLAENGAAIHSVMIDGRFIVRDRRLLTVDEARLRQEAEEAVARLDMATADAARAANQFGDRVGYFCRAPARAPFHVHRRLPDDVPPECPPSRPGSGRAEFGPSSTASLAPSNQTVMARRARAQDRAA